MKYILTITEPISFFHIRNSCIIILKNEKGAYIALHSEKSSIINHWWYIRVIESNVNNHMVFKVH